jgi:hypothetical protein
VIGVARPDDDEIVGILPDGTIPRPVPMPPGFPLPLPPRPVPLPEVFPENEVAILPEYVPRTLAPVLTQVRTALKASIITLGGEPTGPNADRVQKVLGDRKKFLQFLEHPLFQKTLGLMDEIGDLFQGREFRQAEALVKQLDDASVPVLNIGNAFTPTPISFVEIQERERPGGHGDRNFTVRVRVPRTLPGYRGIHPPIDQITQIMKFNGLLVSEGRERTFRMALLQAEIQAGLRNFAGAIAGYKTLLDNASNFRPEPMMFVALRKALAHLALGDATFKKSRALSTADRTASRTEYVRATDLMKTHGISTRNPVRKGIDSYATAQIAKLDAGFNAIGFKDSYVPRLKAEFLLQKAEERRAAAVDAAAKYRDFREAANQLDEQEAEARLDADINAISAEIAAERQEIEGLEGEKIADRIEVIQDHLDDLFNDTALSMTVGAMSAIGLAVSQQWGGAVQSTAGLISSLASYESRQNDLENELKAARIEQQINEREKTIANLEKSIVDTRGAFLRRKIQGFGTRVLTAELFYALSSLYEDLADTNLEAAIRWAYLAERAVSFKQLRTDLTPIKLDYRKAIAGFDTVLPAPDLLRADLAKVSDANDDVLTGQVLVENPISLRQRYPLEFARFLQTRTLDFTISLYDLDKPRPGVERRRLRKVEVKVEGLIPSTGFSGHIIHRGFFTLRDRASTLTATRLMPRPEEFDTAMNELLDGKAQGDPIGGVIPFLLGEERQELSGSPQPDDNNPHAIADALFVGYGETGHWTLVIDGLDLRRVNDVLVIFTIEHNEGDKQLELKVEELIRAYEAEQPDGIDNTAFFPLRQQFPDAFFALESGQTTFELRESDFPTDIVATKVKTIVGQAIDVQGEGVEGVALEFAQANGDYVVSRTTVAGGFTEVVDEEIPVTPRDQRVPIVGPWVVRLADPSQFARLDDLRLFFVYEFVSR